jgi:large conductance mechanosensitive channel
MKDFMNFVQTQGVVGLAVGLVLGGAVADVVKAIVDDIVNPIVGLLLNSAEGLKAAYFSIGSAKIMYGDLLNTLINFVVIAFVIYFGVKKLGLEKMDKKAE